MSIISNFHSHKDRPRWYIQRHCTSHKGLFKVQNKDLDIVAYVSNLSTQRLKQEDCRKLYHVGDTVSLRAAKTIYKIRLFLKKKKKIVA